MRVLLLRPHDFIVEDMTAWVRSLGLEPVRFRSLEELPLTPREGVAAAVVSMAVSSQVKATVRDVVFAARKHIEDLPLVLTGLSTLDKAKPGIELELKGLGITVYAANESPAWGSPSVGLYAPAPDLKGPNQAELSATARRHFKLDR